MGFQIGAIAAMQEQDRKAELMLQWLKDHKEIYYRPMDIMRELDKIDEEADGAKR